MSTVFAFFFVAKHSYKRWEAAPLNCNAIYKAAPAGLPWGEAFGFAYGAAEKAPLRVPWLPQINFLSFVWRWLNQTESCHRS